MTAMLNTTEDLTTEDLTITVPFEDTSANGTAPEVGNFATVPVPQSFWESPDIHPEAAKLPMMTADQLDMLAADIRANGLQHPVVLLRDNRKPGEDGTYPLLLLDGRNRLAALRTLNITDPNKAKIGHLGPSNVIVVDLVQPDGKKVNAEKFVASANRHRRHLTTAQKRAAIRAYIEAYPKMSDNQVGQAIGVDHKTVGAERKRMNGEVPNTDAQPKGEGEEPKRERVTTSDLFHGISTQIADLHGDVTRLGKSRNKLTAEQLEAVKTQAADLRNIAAELQSIVSGGGGAA